MRKLMIVFMIAIVASQAPPIQAEPHALDIHYQLYAQFNPFVSAVLIKNARIEVYQKITGHPDKFLTAGYINSTGNYYTQVNPVPQAGGVNIYFKVYATDDISIKVMSNSADDSTVYGFISPIYTITGNIFSREVFIDFNHQFIGAFKIYKQILDARAYFIAKANWNIYTMLRIQWHPAAGTDTVYYDDAVKTIFLTRQNWDQPDIILHEYGHFINQLLYPPFSTDTGCPIALPENPPRPRCAWQEGFATYLGAMIQGDPSYAGNFNDTGTVDFNLETGIHSVRGRALGADDPGAVAAFLWDIFDRRKETCDTIHSGFNGTSNNGIWRIINDYYPPTVVFFWSGWNLSDNGMNLQVDTLAEHHGFYSETPTCVNSQWDAYYTIFLPYHRLNEPIPSHR